MLIKFLWIWICYSSGKAWNSCSDQKTNRRVKQLGKWIKKAPRRWCRKDWFVSSQSAFLVEAMEIPLEWKSERWRIDSRRRGRVVWSRNPNQKTVSWLVEWQLSPRRIYNQSNSGYFRFPHCNLCCSATVTIFNFYFLLFLQIFIVVLQFNIYAYVCSSTKN